MAQELAEQLHAELLRQLASDGDSKECGAALGHRCVFAAVPKETVRMGMGEWTKTREAGVIGDSAE